MDATTVSLLNTAVTIVGFIATIASLILAIGAIWLSMVFFKMSDKASTETTEAAKDIKASVERLENIFDKLYSDTFTMMKDTVTDMRQHIWKKPSDKKNDNIQEDDEKIKELKESISKEIISMVDEKVKNIGSNDGKIKEIEESIKRILESNISKSLNNRVVSRATMRRRLLSLIERYRAVRVDKLVKLMEEKYLLDNEAGDGDAMTMLFELRENGLVTWDGPENKITSTDIVKYCNENGVVK